MPVTQAQTKQPFEMTMVQFKERCKVAIVCDTCFDDITNANRVRCIECKEDECIACFVASCVRGTHASHFFKVIDPSRYQGRDEKWSLINEYIFFEGLKLYGVGNWQDMSLFVPGMTEKDIHEHFISLFCVEAREENIIGDAPKFSNPNFHHVWSYMPLRQDFEGQYRDDFERIIKDITFGDEGIGIRAKTAVFEIYKTILNVRSYRESFMLKRRIVEMKELSEREKSYDDFRQGLLCFCKPLATLLSKSDFNVFFDGCTNEHRLRGLARKDVYALTNAEVELCNSSGLSYTLFTKVRKRVIVLMKRKKGFELRDVAKHLTGKGVKIDEVFSFFAGRRVQQ